nr:hypothetical protein [Tanacetum cinerariifolium]
RQAVDSYDQKFLPHAMYYTHEHDPNTTASTSGQVNKKPGRRVVIGISRPLSRVVTGTTVKITTVMDLTGEVVVTTTAAATTTTLVVTTVMDVTKETGVISPTDLPVLVIHLKTNKLFYTRIPVIDVTKETGVISLTDLPILVLSNPGVPLRVTPIQFVLLVDVDTKESVVELQADRKPGASGHVFAITEGQAANTSG